MKHQVIPQAILDQDAAIDVAIAEAQRLMDAEMNPSAVPKDGEPDPNGEPLAQQRPSVPDRMPSLEETLKAAEEPQAVVPPLTAPGTTVLEPKEPDSVQKAEADRQAEVERLQQELSTLRGKYNAETAANTARIEGLVKDIKEMQSQPVAPPVPETPAYQKYMTDEERAEYTNRDEALDTSGRAVLGEAERRINEQAQANARERAEINDRLKRIEADQAKERAQDSFNAFMGEVESICEDAIKINNEPTFTAFLQTRDEHGRQYGDMANAAVNVSPHEVARIINKFKAISGYKTPSQVDVTNQIRPEKATASTGVDQPKEMTAKPRITQAQIQQFNEDIAKGKYGQPSEAYLNPDVIKIQKEIDSAGLDGRVV